MDISIIIVSWNVKDRLRANLSALLYSQGVSFEIILIDNASTDSTAEMIRKEFSEIRFIANSKNLGFAKASNQGIKQAQGRYVLLLNPDMKVFPDTLLKTVAWLDEHTHAAIAGIKLQDEAGINLPQVRRFPTLKDQAAIALKLPHLWPGVMKSYLRADFDYMKAARVDSIRGAFFVIRRSTIEQLGLLDERYFLWFEEVDYCRQAKQKGLEVWYTSAARAVDYVGQSFNKVKRSTKQGYIRRSMIAYFQKWAGFWPAIVLRACWFIGSIIMLVADILKLKSRTRT